jgi:hypothetical protein
MAGYADLREPVALAVAAGHRSFADVSGGRLDVPVDGVGWGAGR